MATSRLGLAAVLLNEPRLRSAKAYAEAIEKMLPGVPVSVMGSSKEVRELKVGESEVYIPLMPRFPWQDLVTLTETCWHWKESRELLRLHEAHILVTLRLGPDDPLERAMLLSKVTAAVLSAQDCLGVYWYGPAISSAKDFLAGVKVAVEGGRYPLLSWLSFGLCAEESGVSVITQGMDELGHKELEVIAEPDDATAFEYTLTLCEEVLRKGRILKHGERIGRVPGEKFRIQHRAASWDESREVIEVDMRKKVWNPKKILGKLLGKRAVGRSSTASIARNR
jgi:hypothetical protein